MRNFGNMARPESGIDIKSTKQAKTPITNVNSFTNHNIETNLMKLGK
jgi:hypothetical protein